MAYWHFPVTRSRRWFYHRGGFPKTHEFCDACRYMNCADTFSRNAVEYTYCHTFLQLPGCSEEYAAMHLEELFVAPKSSIRRSIPSVFIPTAEEQLPRKGVVRWGGFSCITCCDLEPLLYMWLSCRVGTATFLGCPRLIRWLRSRRVDARPGVCGW